MDNKINKFISVNYQLFSVDADGSKHLVEETKEGNPFQLISGFGISIDKFEEKIIDLETGSNFDFTLTPADAFGEYDSSCVHKMGREVFSINGHFDHENIFEGAVITLMDNDGKRFMVLGRKDNVVCCGGVKIQAEEVEERLQPYIDTPFFVGKEKDDKFGEILVLVVEKRDKKLLEDIIGNVLPKYWRPRKIYSVEKLPLTETGKPKRLVNDFG